MGKKNTPSLDGVGWLGLDDEAAGDGDDLAGHVAGVIADEEAHPFGDFLGGGEASHGDVFVEAGEGVFAEAGDHVGFDTAWSDGVDTDAAVRELFGEGAGEGFNGAFGGAVGDLAGGGVPAPDGAEVEDDALLAVDHAW